MSDATAQQPPKRVLRSIEKSRTATCAFADVVATRVIEAFRGLPLPLDAAAEEALRGLGAQTCLAAVVVLAGETGELDVVSLGAGTKIAPEACVREDAALGRRVRDCHAEVLARRGFVRFLYAQLRLARANPGGATRCIFDERGYVRPGVTFHFYCSSAPCGNACIRKWGKVPTEVFHANLGPLEWRTLGSAPHPRFFTYHPLQVAVLCKMDPGVHREDDVEEENGEVEVGTRQQQTKTTTTKDGNPAPDSILPNGLALPDSPLASSRASCSDKMARWCATGLEGTLLRSCLPGDHGDIRPQTVIVGRKFCRPHLERAVCCRLTTFWESAGQHPTVLCTGVKLQEGGLVAEDKARFSDFALVWAKEWDEQRPAEVLSGSEGLVMGSLEPSMVSRCRLLELWARQFHHREEATAAAAAAVPCMSAYRAIKAEVDAVPRRQRIHRLLTEHLKQWPRQSSHEGTSMGNTHNSV